MHAPRRRPSHRIQSGPPPQWRAALSAQPALERVFVLFFFCGAGAGSVICYCLLISVAPPHCNCQRQQPPPPAPAAPRAALTVGRDLGLAFGPKLGRCTSVLERLRRKVWYFRGVVLVNMATLLAMRRSRRCLLARTTKQHPQKTQRAPAAAPQSRAQPRPRARAAAASHTARARARPLPVVRPPTTAAAAAAAGRATGAAAFYCVCVQGGEGCETAAQRAASGKGRVSAAPAARDGTEC